MLLCALSCHTVGVVVLTLIINIFRVRKIGFKSVFVMVSPHTSVHAATTVG